MISCPVDGCDGSAENKSGLMNHCNASNDHPDWESVKYNVEESTEDTETMATQQQNTEKIAQQINDFSKLKARQITLFQWRVLSWRNGELTAHEVNIKDRDCSCEDMKKNKTGENEICDHLAVALFHAPRTIDVGDAISHDMKDKMVELQNAVDAIERRATAIKSQSETDTPDTSSNGSQGNSDASKNGHSNPVDNPLAAATEWMEEQGFPVGTWEIEMNEQFGSINIAPTQQVDWWKDMTDELQDHDNSWWNGDDRIWIIQEDDFNEVFA